MISSPTITTAPAPVEASKRAVAYYRSSMTESDGAIESQREQVRGWAEKNGIEIVREFVDTGTSGLHTQP